MEIALGVEVTDVPGAQPAVDDGLRGLVGLLVVALHHQVAVYTDLPRIPPRQDFIVLIHEFYPDQWIGPAHRGEAFIRGQLAVDEMVIRRQVGDSRGRLGLAVTTGHNWTPDLDGLLEFIHGHGRCAVHQVLHRGHIDFLDTRNFQQLVNYCRGQEKLRDPVLRNGVKDQRGLGLAHHDHRTALAGTGHGKQAGSVGHRRRRQVNRALIRAVTACQHIVGDEGLGTAMSVHHPLGHAGGAAGGRQHHHVVHVITHLGPGTGRTGCPLFQRQGIGGLGVDADPVFYFRQAGPQFGNHRLEIALVEHHVTIK